MLKKIATFIKSFEILVRNCMGKAQKSCCITFGFWRLKFWEKSLKITLYDITLVWCWRFTLFCGHWPFFIFRCWCCNHFLSCYYGNCWCCYHFWSCWYCNCWCCYHFWSCCYCNCSYCYHFWSCCYCNCWCCGCCCCCNCWCCCCCSCCWSYCRSCFYNICRVPGFEPKILRPQTGVLPMSYTFKALKLLTL